MRYAVGNSETGVRIRSVDGTSYRIGAASVAEYLLHPVFLRFFFCALMLCALLDQRPQQMGLQGWGVVLAWVSVGAVVLLWLAIGSALSFHAIRRGWIGHIYTPVLLLPVVGLTALVMQALAAAFGNGSTALSPLSVQLAARDILVIALFDLLHGQAVVWAHPLAHPEAPHRAEQPAAEPVADPVPAQHPPSPVQPPQTAAVPPVAENAPPSDGLLVQIGPVSIPLSSILLVRTEDHYLGVTTRTGTALHRAKMADIPELHTGIAGMQINRSVWVAYAAIKDVTDAENRQVVVTLVTGDEERVARPRTFAFRQSWAKFRASQAAG